MFWIKVVKMLSIFNILVPPTWHGILTLYTIASLSLAPVVFSFGILAKAHMCLIVIRFVQSSILPFLILLSHFPLPKRKIMLNVSNTCALSKSCHYCTDGLLKIRNNIILLQLHEEGKDLTFFRLSYHQICSNFKVIIIYTVGKKANRWKTTFCLCS